MKALLQTALCAALISALASCGNGSEKTCRIVGVRVAPATANADHLAPAPASQVQFGADGAYEGSCALPACVNCLPGVTWTVSDPANVSLTPAQTGLSTVVATCMGATNGPATVTASKTDTASGKTVTGTATLTCR